jgi:hypothetical protein
MTYYQLLSVLFSALLFTSTVNDIYVTAVAVVVDAFAVSSRYSPLANMRVLLFYR